MCFFSKKIQLYSLQMNLKCLVDEDELLTDSKNLAGMAGFEPANDGIKTRCLTTWRHPNCVMVMYLLLLRQIQTI